MKMSIRNCLKNNAFFRRLYNLIQIHIHGKSGIYLMCKGLGKRIRIYNHGTNNKISVGCGTLLINCSFHCFGNDASIVIGDECYLRDVDFWIEDNGGNIAIREKTKMIGRAQLASMEGCSIIIGDSCLFSSDVYIRTGDSHSILDLNHKRINPSKSVSIGNHVWVGQSVKILKGVKVMDNTVVGAGAVVTKPFHEDHIAIAGNPAKCVKTNIDWTYER